MPPSPDNEGPSTTAIALATAILSFATGYFLGSASSLNLFSSPSSARKPTTKKEKTSWPNSYDVNIHPDSSDEELMASLGRQKSREVKDSEDEESESSDDDEGEGDGGAKGELSTFSSSKEECKLVLVVRSDLGMGKGKISAQCSHATLANYTTLLRSNPTPTPTSNALHPILQRWQRYGQAKVVVQCASEEEMMVLQAQAMSLGLCANIVHDAGRTQVASGTATVLGVGPGPKSVVDQVTGGLKLL